MKKLLLLAPLFVTSVAFANQTTSGFLYETKTQVGSQYLIKWPSLKVDSKVAYIRIGYGSAYSREALGNAVCKIFGYKSGSISIVEVGNVDFVDLAADGSIESFGTPDEYFFAVSNAICSNK